MIFLPNCLGPAIIPCPTSIPNSRECPPMRRNTVWIFCLHPEYLYLKLYNLTDITTRDQRVEVTRALFAKGHKHCYTHSCLKTPWV